jgi:hypothetical protein
MWSREGLSVVDGVAVGRPDPLKVKSRLSARARIPWFVKFKTRILSVKSSSSIRRRRRERGDVVQRGTFRRRRRGSGVGRASGIGLRDASLKPHLVRFLPAFRSSQLTNCSCAQVVGSVGFATRFTGDFGKGEMWSREGLSVVDGVAVGSAERAALASATPA